MWRDELDDYSDYERDLDLLEMPEDMFEGFEGYTDDEYDDAYCDCASCRGIAERDEDEYSNDDDEWQ